MNLLPVSLQATQVVPEPQKQSNTMSFGWVLCNICLLTNSNGLIVGCSYLSLSSVLVCDKYHLLFNSYPSFKPVPFSLIQKQYSTSGNQVFLQNGVGFVLHHTNKSKVVFLFSKYFKTPRNCSLLHHIYIYMLQNST